MEAPSRSLVLSVLSAYLGVDAAAIRDDAQLERDLGLDPLDVVLVLLRLEDATPGVKDVDVGDLAEARTVADFVDLFESRWDRDTVDMAVVG
jgi:acyl carrier protein